MPLILKPVPDFPGYFVRMDGTVWTTWGKHERWKTKRLIADPYGGELHQLETKKVGDRYITCCLRREDEKVEFSLHRLILEVFRGPCPEGMEARHLDGDKYNNWSYNLRWGTHQENEQDKVRHGTARRGTEAAALVNRGKKRPPEFGENLSRKLKGRKFTEEHRQAISDNHWTKGPNAEEGKAKMVGSLTGRKLTEEHKQKISTGLAKAFGGKSDGRPKQEFPRDHPPERLIRRMGKKQIAEWEQREKDLREFLFS